MNCNYCMVLFGMLLMCLAVVQAQGISEMRVKIGGVVDKLNYPGKLVKFQDFGADSSLVAAIDFKSDFKPNFIQLALISKASNSALTFDFEYKELASKATLSLNMKRLKPGTVELGSEYTVMVYVAEAGKQVLAWDIGSLTAPESIDYKIPEIEDHFYAQPEICTPEPEIVQGKKNPLYPLIGLLFVVALPWISFMKMWNGGFGVPEFLLNSSKSKAFPFFTASLGGLFLLIISAWIYLSIFQTLGFLAVLSSSAFVFGHISFKNLVQKSLVDKNTVDKQD